MKTTQHGTWRLWLGGVVALVIVAALTFRTLCPKGFVRFSGYPDAGTVSCIAHGGISTPEHYLQLAGGGRIGMFGGPFQGEGGHTFLMRTNDGKWICGQTKKARFSFQGGEAEVERVATILDEATAPRSGTIAMTGLGGGVFGDCPGGRVTVDGDVLKLTLDATSAGGGASAERDRVDLMLSGRGVTVALWADLDAPWPERGDAEVGVARAWVRLTELVEGRAVRRLAAAGTGRLSRKGGCASLTLEKVTPLAVCPAEGEARGSLSLSW